MEYNLPHSELKWPGGRHQSWIMEPTGRSPGGEATLLDRVKATKFRMLGAILLAAVCAGLVVLGTWNGTAAAASRPGGSASASDAAGNYVVLSWNDLGMHCYNPSFQDIGVLPPWNTVWAQVVRVGDPPEIVTAGVKVTFAFPDNTYSTGVKSDFWDKSPYSGIQNAQWLFGDLFKLTGPLPPSVGLTGTGLSGEMEQRGDHFVAEGIPLTEYQDSAPAARYPYQLATVIAYDANTNQELARTRTVAPVSTEMRCDTCHGDNGEGNEGIATGVVEQNILTKHDDEHMAEYPSGHEGRLMDRRPVLCAECHASNALGAPGAGDVPNLSEAIHEKHAEKVTQDLDGCYTCHPGPETKCLRDVMSTSYQMDCVDCHGTMEDVANNPNPWLSEPTCTDTGCHGNAYAQDKPLYRESKEHGDVYCEACHDSTHAIAPSRESNDTIKFIDWQGHNGPLDTCTVCHSSWPAGAGPHGKVVPPPIKRDIYLPLVMR
jgi:hypothetical protein